MFAAAACDAVNPAVALGTLMTLPGPRSGGPDEERGEGKGRMNGSLRRGCGRVRVNRVNREKG